MVTPGQFCSKLQNLRVKPRLGKGPHVAKIPQAKAVHAGKLVAEILGQPIHHLGSPALGRKAGGKVLPDGPVEQSLTSSIGTVRNQSHRHLG